MSMEMAGALLKTWGGGCQHLDPVPVRLLLTGELVAWLCPDCLDKLPAEWAQDS
jgi:hypothetical protein